MHEAGAHITQRCSATRSAEARMLSTVPLYRVGMKPTERHSSITAAVLEVPVSVFAGWMLWGVGGGRGPVGSHLASLGFLERHRVDHVIGGY
jgi:hypothetical protein